MKKSLSVSAAAVASLLGSWGALSAQAQERVEAAPEMRVELLAQAPTGKPMVMEREVRFVTPGDDLQNSRVVKGAPYCADAVHETTQWLVDPASNTPNKIARKNSTRMCRDGEGRTRQEMDGPGRKQVFLRDPVAKESWMLDPERKTAIRLGAIAPAAPVGHPADGAAWREYGERMREWAKELSGRVRHEVMAVPAVPPAPPVPPAPGAPATPAAPPVPAAPPMPMADGTPSPVYVTRNETVSPDGKRREVEVHVIRRGPGDAALPPLADMAPPGEVMIRAERMAPRGAGVVTALPTKDIEGVKANGERTTWTIEAGKIGNEKAIVQTREVWTSPELMLTVYSRDIDPRSGETVYRLSNLKRGEPDAAQFKVPAGYEVTEPNMAPRGLRILKQKTPAPAPSTSPAATGKG
ncbi:MAG: hypothetical protein H7Y28_00935 [Rhodoferax sp.]|nr:hypothetical protein [Rhodoferax sp.]